MVIGPPCSEIDANGSAIKSVFAIGTLGSLRESKSSKDVLGHQVGRLSDR